jgi:hypothetical protein
VKPARRAALILSLAALGLPGPAAAQERPSLQDFAWISGHWRNPEGGNLSEEIWTPPHGDSLLGMWRYVGGERARIFELLAITAGDDGIVLRLRHFDPKFVGREDKDRGLVLKLVRSGEREAVFEGPEYSGQGSVRITYRAPSPDELVAVLEKPGGKPQEFRYRRAGTR